MLSCSFETPGNVYLRLMAEDHRSPLRRIAVVCGPAQSEEKDEARWASGRHVKAAVERGRITDTKGWKRSRQRSWRGH